MKQKKMTRTKDKIELLKKIYKKKVILLLNLGCFGKLKPLSYRNMFKLIRYFLIQLRRILKRDRKKITISYRLPISWPCIVLQKQPHYGLVIVTFSFLQWCTLKLKTKRTQSTKTPLV